MAGASISVPRSSRDSLDMHGESCTGLSLDRSRITLDDLDMLNTLGTGTFGRVYLCRCKSNPDCYLAIKSMSKRTIIRLRQLDHVFNERNILSKIDFPFVVRLYNSFQTSTHIYLLFEYVVGGELFSYLRRLGRFSVSATRFYTSEILLALEHLHQHSIVYRDLKPENILLDVQGHIKLTDFGFSKVVRDQTHTFCGTPEYLAPEVIQGNGYEKNVDWWALGILIYEMLVGVSPFSGSNASETYKRILQAQVWFPDHVDVESRNLISGLLCVDKSRRLGARCGGVEIASHPWFRDTNWKALMDKTASAPFVPAYMYPGDTSNFDTYSDPEEPLPTDDFPYDYLFRNF